MATREELYTALRNADAAGDDEGAAKLAAYIQSLPIEAAPASLPVAPNAQPATAEEPGIYTRIDKAITPAMIWARTNIPLVAQAEDIGADATRLAGKAASGFLNLVGAGKAAEGLRNATNVQLPQSDSLISQGLGKVGQAVKTVTDPIDAAARGNDPNSLRATLYDKGTEALTDVASVLGVKGTPAGAARAVKVEGRAATGQSRPTLSLPKRSAQTAEDVLSRMSGKSAQSMGAASASPSLTGVTPELKAAVVRTAKKNGGVVNNEVLGRHVEAESLPVPMRLTEGQATQDPALLSNEMNLRGRHQQLAQRFNEQNGQLIENVQAIRDNVGPDVFSTNMPEHGDTLIAAYKAKNDAAQQVISQKYEDLRNAAGGSFPVDAKALLSNASKKLHKELLFDHAPKAIMNTLDRLAETGMTFENFEALRTNLARIQRSVAADGNEKAAAGVIREAMEELPLGAGAAQLKPYADAARAAARTQFKALEADPAYKAAVNDTIPPDRFVQKYIISAPRDDVSLMRQNLSHDPTALQTMGVSALDHLRSSARIDAGWNGNFTQSGYNKALQGLSPKLKSLVDPRTAEQLETLGNVARYTQFQPRGSYVNNSNTMVAAAADYGASTAEGMVNVAAAGVPVGTWARKAIKHVSVTRKVQQATAPGAGLQHAPPSQNQLPRAASRRQKERNELSDLDRR